MSIAEFPTRAEPPPISSAGHTAEHPLHLSLTLEQAAYIGLFALALLTHLWGLGDRALHHDETLHAAYSWRLYIGQGFIHDPLLHGPFLYHIVAFMYLLFGDSDYTARLSVALFGSVLVVLPYFIRRELGRGAALLAACYLALSPAFLYVGRFIRHDMYAVVFELVTVIGIVRYASTRRARWLYLSAAALGLMSTTMETFYLYVAIIGSLLVLVFLWRIWWPGLFVAALLGLAVIALVFVLPGKPQSAALGVGAPVTRANGTYVCPSAQLPNPPDNPIVADPGPLLGWPPLATADNDYALCVRNQNDDRVGVYLIKLGQFFGHPAIIAALVLSLLGVIALYVLIWRWRDSTGETAWERACANNDGMVNAFASLGRNPRIWIALGAFLTPYVLFFTAFFRHPVGIISGTTGSLLYWLAQHHVQRGDQPRYYYLVQLVVYEPIVLLWAVIGCIMAVVVVVRRLLVQRHTLIARTGLPIDWQFAMPVLLTWWSLATFVVYSWAGEKMPWLTIHVALPLVLLGAWALARIFKWWMTTAFEPDYMGFKLTSNSQKVPVLVSSTPRIWDGALTLFLGMLATLSILFLLLITIVGKPGGEEQAATPFIFPGALILVALMSVFAGMVRGARWVLGALALGVTLIGTLYGVRSSYQLNYHYGDDARELLVFVQTTPDVPRVVKNLEQAATKRNGDLTIWYDNETIWQWYLRNFKNSQQQPPTIPMPDKNVMAILLLQDNISTNSQDLQNLQGFHLQTYPLRWWNPEYELYRLPQNWLTAPVDEHSSLLLRMLRRPLDGRTAAQFWQYMLFRQVPAALGSTDFVLAIRPELAHEMGLGTGIEQK